MLDGDEDAFPFPGTSNWLPTHGLTKREFFAAVALQGVIASNALNSPDDCAHYAVMAADSLLQCLKQKP